MKDNPTFARRIRRHLEAGFIRALLMLFGMLAVDRASATGGALARFIGPLLAVNRTALRNLRTCFPEKSDTEIAQIIDEMWDNLGRSAAELAHLGTFKSGLLERRMKTIGAEFIDQVVAADKGAIFVSGHLGNWELQPLTLVKLGLPMMEVYRAATNPLADEIIIQLRRTHVTPHQAEKGASGARKILKWLQQKKYIAMLVDQKMNDGVEAPFFGRPAMTPVAAAQLARRFGCPIILATMYRTTGVNFVQQAEVPFYVAQTSDREQDILIAITEINARLERFIRAHPGQWLWLHRRWPD